jgi:hypothetical protein
MKSGGHTLRFEIPLLACAAREEPIINSDRLLYQLLSGYPKALDATTAIQIKGVSHKKRRETGSSRG